LPQFLKVAIIDRCLKKVVGLGERCVSSKQCQDPASECRFGLCQCLCSFKPTAIFGKFLFVLNISFPFYVGEQHCSNPDDPLRVGEILTRVEQIFQNRHKGLSGGGGGIPTRIV
jgi:hypothetical protein